MGARGCLGDPSLAGPVGVFWAAGHNYTKPGGNDVQTFADLLADHMAFAAAVACVVVKRDHLFDAWPDAPTAMADLQSFHEAMFSRPGELAKLIA